MTIHITIHITKHERNGEEGKKRYGYNIILSSLKHG